MPPDSPTTHPRVPWLRVSESQLFKALRAFGCQPRAAERPEAQPQVSHMAVHRHSEIAAHGASDTSDGMGSRVGRGATLSAGRHAVPCDGPVHLPLDQPAHAEGEEAADADEAERGEQQLVDVLRRTHAQRGRRAVRG